MKRLPRIAISIGDPAGVGAEIALKALCDGEIGAMAQWLVVGDSAVLRAAGRTTGIDPGSLPCTLIETGDLRADHNLAFGQLRLPGGFHLPRRSRVAGLRTFANRPIIPLKLVPIRLSTFINGHAPCLPLRFL